MDRNYIITNGKEYLKFNFQVTKSRSLAGNWNIEIANNIMENIKNSSKFTKYNFEVRFQNINEIQDQQIYFKEVFEINTLKDKLTLLADISEEICRYNEFLNRQYSIVEREISDIRHYVEFSNMNVCKGYKICKLLKEKLILRRRIKDEQLVIDKLKEIRLLQFRKADIQETFDYLETRKYGFGILDEQFKNNALA